MSSAGLFGPESHPVGDSEFDFSGKKRDPYDPESIRLRNLDREVTVRTIGLIYLIGAVLTVLNTAILLSSDKLMAAMLKAVNPQVLTPETFRTFMIIFVGISSVIMLAFGFALRSFSNVIRWVIVVFSVIALLGGLPTIVGVLTSGKITIDTILVLIGLVPTAMFTWFLASSKNATVFSSEYRSVIAQTPDVQRQLGSRDILFLSAYFVIFVAGLVVTGIKLAGGA